MSFPSGHSQAAVVGYSVILVLFLPLLGEVWRKVAVVVAILMVLAIGFSRVALAAHYVSDVLAGFVLGLAWVVLTVTIFDPRREPRPRTSTRGTREAEPRST
jgi:undecaprenyl-diphosphatase